MKLREVASNIFSTVPWVHLEKRKDDGELFVVLDGEFNLEALKYLVHMLESVEPEE